MTVNGKEKDIAAILSFNHGNDTNEKFSTTKNLSTKTTTRLLNEVENFSPKRKINPITVDDVAATYSQKRNSTSNGKLYYDNKTSAVMDHVVGHQCLLVTVWCYAIKLVHAVVNYLLFPYRQWG